MRSPSLLKNLKAVLLSSPTISVRFAITSQPYRIYSAAILFRSHFPSRRRLVGGQRQDHQEFDERGHLDRRLQEEAHQAESVFISYLCLVTADPPLGEAALEKAKLFSKTATKGKA
jgi:hypothetical protein